MTRILSDYYLVGFYLFILSVAGDYVNMNESTERQKIPSERLKHLGVRALYHIKN